MKKIKNIINKPSDNILSIINALDRLKYWDNFELSTDTFGQVKNNIAYGCIATISSHYLCKKKY